MPTKSLERFNISKVLEVGPGQGGLPRLKVTAPAAEGEIYLHGAHVTHFQPKGAKPVLFMSKQSLFQPDKAIRGGVPVIFPWFGARAGKPHDPAHGLVRTMPWSIEKTDRAGDAVQVVLTLKSGEATRKTWPHDFELHYAVTFGKTLEMALTVKNTSHDAYAYEEALHTYFDVADARHASVSGLEGVVYLDKVEHFAAKPQGPEPIHITGETDRVYLHTKSACTIKDPEGKRKIVVEKEGSDATVVWNPWVDKAKAMSDFGDDEWHNMICVETCNVMDAAVKLEPGHTHTMTQRVRVA